MIKAKGYAMLTALIFLIVLTLVALTAMRVSGLELRMSSNNALRTESFEASESPRLILSNIIDVHAFNRGWPSSAGGDISNGEFGEPFPTGLSLTDVKDWYVGNNDESGNCLTAFQSSSGTVCVLRSDASYSRDVAATGQTPFPVRSDLAVFKVRVDLVSGSGTAMLAGYDGTGRSAASSGGRIFFYGRSTGRDATPDLANSEAVTETGAMFRHVIRN